MKKVLRITGFLLLVVILLVAGLLVYVKAALPNIGPPPAMEVDRTPGPI